MPVRPDVPNDLFAITHPPACDRRANIRDNAVATIAGLITGTSPTIGPGEIDSLIGGEGRLVLALGRGFEDLTNMILDSISKYSDEEREAALRLVEEN